MTTLRCGKTCDQHTDRQTNRHNDHATLWQDVCGNRTHLALRAGGRCGLKHDEPSVRWSNANAVLRQHVDRPHIVAASSLPASLLAAAMLMTSSSVQQVRRPVTS